MDTLAQSILRAALRCRKGFVSWCVFGGVAGLGSWERGWVLLCRGDTMQHRVIIHVQRPL